MSNDLNEEEVTVQSVSEEICIQGDEVINNDEVRVTEVIHEVNHDSITSEYIDEEVRTVIDGDIKQDGDDVSVTCPTHETAADTQGTNGDFSSSQGYIDSESDVQALPTEMVCNGYIDTTHMENGDDPSLLSDYHNGGDDVSDVGAICLSEDRTSIGRRDSQNDMGDVDNYVQLYPSPLTPDDSLDKEVQYLDYVIISFDEGIGDFTEKVLPIPDQNGVIDSETCEHNVPDSENIETKENDALLQLETPPEDATHTISETDTSVHDSSQKIPEETTHSIPSDTDNTSQDLSILDQSSSILVDKRNVFPLNADIIITLRYSNEKRNILGNIQSEKGLAGKENVVDSPQYIRFHMTVLPQDKYRLRTKWVVASTKTLAWNFDIGPFPEKFDTQKKNIRFRLYGKSKSMLSRCYGECFVVLAEVVEAEKTVEIQETLLPKGTLKHMNIKCRKVSRI